MAKRKKPVSAKTIDHSEQVPGPTNNPATNLMMADIVLRAGSYIMRNFVERAFLKGRYGKDTAREMVQNQTLGKTLISFAVAKFASKSIPGMAIVSGGLLARTLYDRSKSRSEAQIEGDADLIERAETPNQRPDT